MGSISPPEESILNALEGSSTVRQQRQAAKSSLLLQLKQETLPYHESLEQYLQLLRPEMTLLDYRTLLERFYGFYAAWEQRAVPLLRQWLPGFFEERRKTPLLERDLQFLGSDPAVLPMCSNLPATDSPLALLGSLYVLEGATLGGQLLSRHFARHLCLDSDKGCSFFSSYGSEVGRRWRGFCELLDSYSSPQNDRVIVESAIRTFCSLGEWLGQEAGCPC